MNQSSTGIFLPSDFRESRRNDLMIMELKRKKGSAQDVNLELLSFREEKAETSRAIRTREKPSYRRKLTSIDLENFLNLLLQKEEGRR